MVEISPLTGSDHADWEVLARAFNTYFETDISDNGYEQAWRRLLDGNEIRGIAARLDGKMVGLAHYRFQASVWTAGSCYLQDLFVDKEVRRQGVARELIDWIAQDAEQHGATSFYWHTEQDNITARAFYDKVARFTGFISYSRKLNTNRR